MIFYFVNPGIPVFRLMNHVKIIKKYFFSFVLEKIIIKYKGDTQL